SNDSGDTASGTTFREITRRAPPTPDDENLIHADRIFIRHGYAPSPDGHRLSVQFASGTRAGVRTSGRDPLPDGGGALLDAGSQQTLIMDLTVGRRWIGGRDWACGGGSIMSGTR